MATRRTTNRNAVQMADNDVRSGSTKTAPLPAAKAEQTGQDTSILKPCRAPQAAVLNRDQIAERATAIWLERGCPRDRDEENWREAEAQLKTELGGV
jgi:hypothetical protein